MLHTIRRELIILLYGDETAILTGIDVPKIDIARLSRRKILHVLERLVDSTIVRIALTGLSLFRTGILPLLETEQVSEEMLDTDRVLRYRRLETCNIRPDGHLLITVLMWTVINVALAKENLSYFDVVAEPSTGVLWACDAQRQEQCQLCFLIDEFLHLPY